MYQVYLNQAAAVYSFLYFFIFLSLQFSNIKFFCHIFLRNCETYKVETWYSCGQMYHMYWNQAVAAYLSLYFFIFLSLQFSNIKILVTLFSGTVRPKGLKLGLHMDSRQMYHVYQNQAVAAYLSLYFFIFLSLQFSNISSLFFSGTVRPRRLKLNTNVDSRQMYGVYWNQAATAYSSLYFFIFLSNFQTLKIFVTLFSGTVRPRRLKLGTHMDSGQMYCVYRNQAAAAYLSLYFSLFFLSSFQTLKFFFILFSGTVRLSRLKLGTHVDSGRMYRTGIRLLLLLISPFFHFPFSQIFNI